jgi:hypothetical protein
MIVEQIRHRLSTEHKEMNQQDIRNGFGDGCFDDGMEQILQISGANLLDPIQLARKTNLAIIAQG